MAHHESAVTDDHHALHTLDVHFSMQLGCSASDLRRPGWTVVPTRAEADPAALLFEQRPLLSVIAPIPRPLGDATPAGRAGVVSVAPELRPALAALLRELSPAQLFTARGLAALESLLSASAPDRLTSTDEAHLRVAYASREGFRPYVGPWLDWIEPLDEAAEVEPFALSLLARYSGGVYAVRDGSAIVSFAGIRPQSPHVAEIGVRTDAAPLRGKGLGRAVVSRATKAILASGRLPLYRHRADNAASARLCAALGYRPYADSLAYFARAR
jgi:RimJ/RimL family protein N-acetyltransferase